MERGVPQVLVLGPFVFLLYDLLAVSTYFHADVNKTLLISDADKWIDVEEKMQHTTFTIKLLYMILPGSTYQAIYIYIFPLFLSCPSTVSSISVLSHRRVLTILVDNQCAVQWGANNGGHFSFVA